MGCPKGHPKQHYFGGTIAQWRGKWGVSPTFRVEPWEYNHQHDKGGKGKGRGQDQHKSNGKGRDSQIDNLRKQLQGEKAAHAKLKNEAPAEEPTSMEVDQSASEKTQPARKQEEAERNRNRIALAKKRHDTEWVLKWTKEQDLPGVDSIQGSINTLKQEMASLQQEEISAKTPREQMQRANKAAKTAKE